MDSLPVTDIYRGYRVWRVQNNYLVSITQLCYGHRWLPGITTAMCSKLESKCKSPPEMNCDCGLYAYKDLKTLVWSVAGAHEYIAGEVLLFGKVIEHEYGYRAEYAEPTVLFGNILHQCEISKEKAQELAKIYGVPYVEPDIQSPVITNEYVVIEKDNECFVVKKFVAYDGWVGWRPVRIVRNRNGVEFPTDNKRGYFEKWIREDLTDFGNATKVVVLNYSSPEDARQNEGRTGHFSMMQLMPSFTSNISIPKLTALNYDIWKDLGDYI